MYNSKNPDYRGIAEYQVFKRLLEIYPKGILSVVSDTFDLFKVITEYLPRLKKEVLSRDGKLVIRPDSGDPVDIICGSVTVIDFGDKVQSLDKLKAWAKDVLTEEVARETPHGECGYSNNIGYFSFENQIYKITIEIYWNRYDKQYYFIDESNIVSCEICELTHSQKGVIELLWDVFGGTVNDQGYKLLDSHIGVILGDGVTLKRAEQICERLKNKGFASTNIVLGIGSYTMGYCTRDNQGSAMKATYVEVNGEGREIFKDPITDDGTKKSATGLLHVTKHNENGYMLVDKVSWETEANGELETLYKDGEFTNLATFDEIRKRLKENGK